jgi:hypothetical protein
LSPEVPDPDPDPVPDPVPDSLFVVDSGFDDEEGAFDDEYRSLYQPPPFSTNAVGAMIFSSFPSHVSHAVIGGSLTACMYSHC